MANQRGLDAKHEQNQQHIIRDTRTLSQRISDFIATPHGILLTLLTLAIFNFVANYIGELFLIIGVFFFIYSRFHKTMLPFRLPMRSERKDYNDTKPGSTKPFQARGIYLFGNELRTKDELWFSNEDMRTHVLIFGSTGSGKTEAMISIAYNALLQASGFIYVDGKGDNSLYAKLFSMVRSMGRDDDMLLINFMTGARDIIGPQEKRLSNTLNPFAVGSSSMLAQLVVSMMDKAAGSPDGDMWKGRAISFVEALMKVLVAMRDSGHILLDANVIRNYFHLPRLEAMVIDKLFIRDGQESVSLEGLPPTITEPINNYVLNLPGYNKEKKGKQVSQVLEQHGFITMQLTRVFTSLADTYGHIMRTNLAEVDLNDVVLNRRILCVLLPALEKAPDELSNLGKVIISTLKAMMASGLGDSVEGSHKDLVESKPTNADSPYLCILDEYGYYAVEGFAVVPAQARSLGFSVIFAGQDLPAFQKASKEEAASIGANTNIKVCMKLEDPTETWDFFMKSAGESYVAHVESFQVDTGSVLGNYQDGRGARVEKRARIDLQDLKEQGLGQAHFFFKSKIVRGAFFFANPKISKHMRMNHFLKVDAPEDNDVNRFKKSLEHFSKLAAGHLDVLQTPLVNEDIQSIYNKLENVTAQHPIERAYSALQYYQTEESLSIETFDKPIEVAVDHLNLFTPLRVNAYLDSLLLCENRETFGHPILQRSDTRDKIEFVQRLCGRTSQQAMNTAIEIISDMEKGSHYPPLYRPNLTVDELSGVISTLADNINLKKQEDAEKKKADD